MQPGTTARTDQARRVFKYGFRWLMKLLDSAPPLLRAAYQGSFGGRLAMESKSGYRIPAISPLRSPSLIGQICLLAIVHVGVGPSVCALDNAIKFDELPFLNNVAVRAIHQDQAGFIWIGTANGLHRYDGHTIINYPFKTTTSDSWVTSICEDQHGVLWVGTKKQGLFQLDPNKSRTLKQSAFDSPHLLRIEQILRDSNDRLWIDTHGTGLFKFNDQTSEFSHYRYDDSLRDHLREGSVTSILEDQQGSIWIGSPSALFQLDPIRESMIRIEGVSEVNSLSYDSKGNIWACNNSQLFVVDQGSHEVQVVRERADEGTFVRIFVDSNDVVWCTLGQNGGLAILDPQESSYEVITNHPNEPYSLSFDTVHTLFEDKGGILWIGTTKGLNKYVRSKQVFQKINDMGQEGRRLPSNVVRAVFQDQAGTVWTSTSEGVVTIDLIHGTVTPLPKNDKVKFHSNIVRDLNGGPNGVISWADNHGLVLYDPVHPQNSTVFPSSTYIRQFCYDGANKYWIAADGGLFLLDLAASQSLEPVSTPIIDQRLKESSPAMLRTVMLDREKRVWYGIEEGGVHWFDPATAEHSNFSGESDSSARSGINVTTVIEDHQGTFWIGTQTGLIRYVEANGNFDPVAELAGANVRGLLEDQSDNIWASTYDALYRLESKTGRVRRFNLEDGLINFRYLPEAVLELRSGKLMFGGLDGIDVFAPDDVIPAPLGAPLVFSSIRVNNAAIAVGNHPHRPQPVTLPYGRNTFDVDFALLDYSNSGSHRYRHQLIGYDEKMRESSHSSNAKYMNLRPGDYTLLVECVSPEGELSESAQLTVIVDTPYWQEKWFLSLLLCSFCASILAVHKVRVRSIQATKNRLREEVAARTNELKEAQASLVVSKERAEEATRAKSQFLANMSHEIRTPVNGIIGLTELMLETPLPPQTRNHLVRVNESSDLLLSIINDILDFSRIEAGKLDLVTSSFCLRDQICDVLHRQAVGIREPGAELLLDIESNVPDALIGDTTRFAQIMTNLVGNALKFTKQGEIWVRVSLESQSKETIKLRFVVADSGIGIEKNKQESIFHEFEQADASTTRAFGGTGLGLAITRNLVDLVGGEIIVESPNSLLREGAKGGPGSVFTFTADFAPETAHRDASHSPPNVEQSKVLVADPHETNRSFISKCLCDWNMQPICVSNEEQVARAIEKSTKDQDPFDLLIISSTLANKVDWQPVNQDRESNGMKKIPTITLASTATRNASSQRPDGVQNALIPSPVKAPELSSIIDRILSNKDRVETPKPEQDELPVGAAFTLRILLAEDDEISQIAVSERLQQWGHSVTIAKDGLEATTLATTRNFDLVFMDLHMPKMDGLTATKRIREHESNTVQHTQIVAMTAAARDEDKKSCLSAGMDGYLRKPVKAASLADSLIRFSQRPRKSADHHSREAGIASSSPPFDKEELWREFGGHRARLEKMLGLFRELAPQQLELVRTAASDRNPSNLVQASHKLKNYFADFHATAAITAAQDLETIGKSGDFSELEESLAKVESEFAALAEALNELLERG